MWGAYLPWFAWYAQAIGCLILFTFANVLSTLLAKMMASHFHKATHFHKMQEAIRKVRAQNH